MNWSTDANCDAPDTEMVFAKITNKKIGNILIGCCYRPPSSDMDYNNSMSSSIRSLMNRNQAATTWIGGDFNLPDIQWRTHQIQGHHNTKSTNEVFLNLHPKLSWSPPYHSDSTQDRSHPSIPAAQHGVMSQECKGPMLHHTSHTHTRI